MTSLPESKPPTRSSYWVVPSQLLAGGYPGAPVEPEHSEKIHALIDAGVRTFVSLMEEHETNHRGEGFNPYLEIAQAYEPSVEFHRFPIKDLSLPTKPAMIETLDAIDRFIETRPKVYVHCWGGVGRTGTVIGCWLLRHGVVEAGGVLQRLKELRRHDVERGRRQSPETDAQCEFVVAWNE